jgi:uncharacterized protein YbcI
VTAGNGPPGTGSALTDAISAALIALYAEFYDHERTTATTYINDNVVVCVLEDILSRSESAQVADGGDKDVIDGRIAFQEGAQDEFTQAVEHLTGRRVTAFLSANQTNPGVACELFFLEAPPAAAG